MPTFVAAHRTVIVLQASLVDQANLHLPAILAIKHATPFLLLKLSCAEGRNRASTFHASHFQVCFGLPLHAITDEMKHGHATVGLIQSLESLPAQFLRRAPGSLWAPQVFHSAAPTAFAS